MKISNKALDLIKEFEGFRSSPYLDAVGVPTIGYGFTHYADGRKVAMTDEPIAKGLADYMLMEIVDNNYGKYVNEFGGEMSQNEFDALVSFSYNLGVNALHHSTLLKKHLAGDTLGAAKEFLKWDNAGGKKLAGLTKRRKIESDLYLS